MKHSEFLREFEDMRNHNLFPSAMDHIAQVELFRAWLEVKDAPAEPMRLTSAQQRTIFLCLSSGWLGRDEVGQVTALTVARASELIEIGFTRRNRDSAGPGFQPPVAT